MTFPAGWIYRFKISSDDASVSASLKGLAYDLSNAPASFWTNVKTDGSDIRISSDIGGTTEVARDVIGINTTAETGLIRFDTSGISTSATTDYWVWYGNGDATEPAAGSTYGAHNSYDANLQNYYPANEGSGSTAVDRLGNKNFTIGNWVLESTNGKFGGYLKHSGTYTEFSTDTNFFSANWSVLMLVRHPNTSQLYNVSNNAASVIRLESNYNNNQGAFRLSNFGSSQFLVSSSGTRNPVNDWCAHIITKNGGTLTIYYGDGTAWQGSIGSGSVGTDRGGTIEFLKSFQTNAGVCEIHQFDRTLSASEAQTLSVNIFENNTFWTTGAQETILSVVTGAATNISYRTVTLNGTVEGL